MTKAEIENKLRELKGKQGDYFKKKKADRNASELTATREEASTLKKALAALVAGK